MKLGRGGPPMGPTVCVLEAGLYALLRINRITNFMLFGKEEPEPWLAKRKGSAFFFFFLFLPISP